MDEADIVQRQIDAYNARDLDGFLGCYSADAVVEDGSGAVMMQGRDAMQSMYGALFSQSPDLHAEIPQRIRLGQWVVDEEHATGMNLEGFPPELKALAVYRVHEGKIARVKLLM